MGSEGYARFRNADCPVCGAEQGAWMSSSAWQPFSGLACDDECGLAAQAALLELHETERFRRIQDRIWRAQSQIAEMEQRAIKSAGLTPNSDRRG
jgi:hypothetical protein